MRTVGATPVRWRSAQHVAGLGLCDECIGISLQQKPPLNRMSRRDTHSLHVSCVIPVPLLD
jgi:hypothetical protein